MRVVYRVAFRLGGEEVATSVPLREVVLRCLDWVFTRKSPRIERPSELDDDVLAEIDASAIGSDAHFETTRAAAEGQHLWGLRFDHADASDDDVRWQTELTVRHDDSSGATHFACVQHRGVRNDRLVPIPPARSRPRIVETLLSDYGAWAGGRLSAKPAVLQQVQARDFVQLLLDDRRLRPVVFVSARNVDDRPVTDANAIASWLAGLAHVVVADTRFPSLALREHLPARLCCWDGAVRVYWPGFRKADDPFRHRLWTSMRVREIDGRSHNAFLEHLLAYVADIAATSMGDPMDTWEGLQIARRRALMSELREAGRTDKLLELADEMIASLESEKRALQQEVETLRADLRASRGREDAWRKAYEVVQRGGAPSVDDQEFVPIEDVAAAVKQAGEQFGAQILFQLNSQSDVEANPFEDAESVWAALEWLGTTYYRARTGEASIANFDLSLRERCGWTYHSHQSAITMKKYKRWYTTRVDGATWWLHEHIGSGSGKDARHTIRIGFDWDKERQRVLIGYIGQHQQTDAT